jgi:glycosyltransferase involved in cell wall biosynthesis
MSNQPKRILHIAPQNISDVPMTLVRAERALGFESRLVTFFPDQRGYPEDYCLRLPFVASASARKIKKIFADPARMQIDNQGDAENKTLRVWQPHSFAEKWLIGLREKTWSLRIGKMMHDIDFWHFDIYQFDAGIDFYRDGRTVRKLKSLGKKIIVLYTGSDLRTRGVIEPVDRLADARFTVEWDHLDLDPALTHILFPFEPEKYPYRERASEGAIKIGHAPTNRAAKGSGRILAILNEIASEREIESVLIENLPHNRAIQMKDRCDIFIDQIGALGYGINALEALAMGIPTCTCLTPGFLKAHPEHAFCEVNADNLKSKLLDLIDKPHIRQDLARRGRAWVEAYHNSRKIVKRIQGKCNDGEHPICEQHPNVWRR